MDLLNPQSVKYRCQLRDRLTLHCGSETQEKLLSQKKKEEEDKAVCFKPSLPPGEHVVSTCSYCLGC